MSKLERIEDPWGDVWCHAEDVDKLEAQNAELLEALKEIMWQTEGNNKSIIAEARAYSIARAAIAKAKGDQP